MPGPGVGDDQARSHRPRPSTEPPRRRFTQRVLDEVRRDLEDAVCVTGHPRLARDGAQVDAELPRGRLVAPRSLARDLGEVDRLRPHRELGTVHAREVEQVANEPLEPAALGADDARRLSRLERALGEPFRVAADRGQRRLQLMADREQERTLAHRVTPRAARPSG